MPCADGYTLAGAVNLRELHDRYGETPTRMTVPAAAHCRRRRKPAAALAPSLRKDGRRRPLHNTEIMQSLDQFAVPSGARERRLKRRCSAMGLSCDLRSLPTTYSTSSRFS
jgi:hypothetical protein